MTVYVDDGDGGQVCADCGVGACVTAAGWQCEADDCRCACRDLDDLDSALGAMHRARELDARPDAALANVARDVTAERTPTLDELRRERLGVHGLPRWGAA